MASESEQKKRFARQLGNTNSVTNTARGAACKKIARANACVYMVVFAESIQNDLLGCLHHPMGNHVTLF